MYWKILNLVWKPTEFESHQSKTHKNKSVRDENKTNYIGNNQIGFYLDVMKTLTIAYFHFSFIHNKEYKVSFPVR